MKSIYPEEFEIVSSNIPYQYKVKIVPNPGSDDNHGEHDWILIKRIYIFYMI